MEPMKREWVLLAALELGADARCVGEHEIADFFGVSRMDMRAIHAIIERLKDEGISMRNDMGIDLIDPVAAEDIRKIYLARAAKLNDAQRKILSALINAGGSMGAFLFLDILEARRTDAAENRVRTILNDLELQGLIKTDLRPVSLQSSMASILPEGRLLAMLSSKVKPFEIPLIDRLTEPQRDLLLAIGAAPRNGTNFNENAVALPNGWTQETYQAELRINEMNGAPTLKGFDLASHNTGFQGILYSNADELIEEIKRRRILPGGTGRAPEWSMPKAETIPSGTGKAPEHSINQPAQPRLLRPSGSLTHLGGEDKDLLDEASSKVTVKLTAKQERFITTAWNYSHGSGFAVAGIAVLLGDSADDHEEANETFEALVKLSIFQDSAANMPAKWTGRGRDVAKSLSKPVQDNNPKRQKKSVDPALSRPSHSCR